MNAQSARLLRQVSADRAAYQALKRYWRRMTAGERADFRKGVRALQKRLIGG